jgi:hypothetical protein
MAFWEVFFMLLFVAFWEELMLLFIAFGEVLFWEVFFMLLLLAFNPTWAQGVLSQPGCEPGWDLFGYLFQPVKVRGHFQWILLDSCWMAP